MSPPSKHRSVSKHDEELLRVTGHSFHVAHTAVVLLRMLQTYMAFQQAVPLLMPDTARTALDLLKVSTPSCFQPFVLLAVPSLHAASKQRQLIPVGRHQHSCVSTAV